MLTWIGGEVSRERKGCWSCAAAIFDGLGSIPPALNINVDQLLILKVLLTEYISLFVFIWYYFFSFKEGSHLLILRIVRKGQVTHDLLI
jgi:hypothetical protein